jgi:hypothetical protein
MNLINVLISVVCAVMWIVLGFREGFTLFRVFVIAMWCVSALLFSVAYIKKKKSGGK